MRRILNWIEERLPIQQTWKRHVSGYYAPKNLNFFYYFGSLALLVLFMQIVSGLWLTMFYTPTASEAFHSIEFIMRDVHGGWFLRYMHSTGASAFFIILYVHLFRGLMYGSYQQPRELVWIFGMGLLVLLMAEAFFGYLLPWGQMSYWGAQVITSLFSVIPIIGDSVVTWIQGDYTVGNATLQRFFALHVIGIPLLILTAVGIHVIALRKTGSNNPDGIEIKKHLDAHGNPLDGIPFHPYYTVKDLFGVAVFLLIFFAVLFFFPEMHGYFLEHDNFTPANPLVTPEHITPVWYLTPFYAILRALPNKAMGVIVMGSALFIFLLLPWLDQSPVRSIRYKGIISKLALLLWTLSFVMLGYLGSVDVTYTKQLLARIATILYFAYFILMPLYTRYESYRPVPERMP